MYNSYIEGKSIYLRQPTQDDVNGKWHEWLSDEKTTLYLSDRYWPNSRELQQIFFDGLRDNRNLLVLSIVDRETDRHIGVCSLSGINWVSRYADFAMIIGEKNFRKGTVAFESGLLLLKIAFLRLNMRILKGAYIKSNDFTRNFTTITGFREIGTFENLCWVDGRYEDLVHVMLTQEEWLKRQRISSF